MRTKFNYVYLMFILFIFFVNCFSNPNLPLNQLSDKSNHNQTPDLAKPLQKQISKLVQGGENFSTATLIDIGSINGSFDSSDGYYEYFKINLSSSSTFIFTLITDPHIIISLYDYNQVFLGSDTDKAIMHVQVQVSSNDFYFIELFRGITTLNTNFTLHITNPYEGLSGGNSFNTAVEISPGIFSSFFSTVGSDEFFMINLQSGIDILVNVAGNFTDFSFYNSSYALQEQIPFEKQDLRLSIALNGYYFVQIHHLSDVPDPFTLLIRIISTGSTFYADGGDSLANATLINSDSIQNSLSSFESSDFFKITLNISTVSFFKLSIDNPPQSDIYMYIYAPNQSIIIFDYGYRPQILQKVISIGLTGFYYVQIQSDHQFTYTLNVTTQSDIYDGGSLFATAKELTTGDYKGYLTNDETDDFYKFLLYTDHDFSFNVTGECNGIYFYNSTMDLIYSDQSATYSIHFSVILTGYYFVQVHHFPNYFGPYFLNVSISQTGSIFYTNGGNSFSTATQIPLGIIQDKIDYDQSYDYFKIVLNVPNDYIFTFSPFTSSNYYVYFALYNSVGSQLAYTYAYQLQNLTLPITTFTNETIVIRISSSYQFDYILNIFPNMVNYQGGKTLPNATEIVTGTFTGFMTLNENTEIYKILANAYYDLFINASGECDGIYLYNSTGYLVDYDYRVNPVINKSIFISDYYYIEFRHYAGSWGNYSFSVAMQSIGTILFVDGGDSFDSAPLIPLGSIQNRITSSEYYDYFSIILNNSSDIFFILTILSNPLPYYYYLYIYSSAHSIIASTSAYSLQNITLPITPQSNDIYFIRIYSSYQFDYNLNIIISAPTNKGGTSLQTASEITVGNINGFMTSNKYNEFFKINVISLNDLFINASGRLDRINLYNSTGYLIQYILNINYIFNISALLSDYYYIGVQNSYSLWGNYTLSVTMKPTGSIFYSSGGDYFDSAITIPFVNVQGFMNYYAYFKIFLNSSKINILELNFTKNYSYVYGYMSIYNLNRQELAYVNFDIGTDFKLLFKPPIDSFYILRIYYNYQSIFYMNFSVLPDKNDGGSDLSTAIELSKGSHVGYLTNDESNEFYKIFVLSGYDIIINVTGECNNFYLYNSSGYVLESESMNGLELIRSISSTDYYYINLQHDRTEGGIYNLTIAIQPTEEIFFADGGESFNSAVQIPIGKTQNEISAQETLDFFKFSSSTNRVLAITLTIPIKNMNTIYLYIYNKNGVILTYNYGSKINIIKSALDINKNVTYYIKIASSAYNYQFDYILELKESFYPSGPINVQAQYDYNLARIIVTWVDSIDPELYYLIYMDSNPIYNINNSIGLYISKITSLNFLGNVSSGIQRFEILNPPDGNYYFAVVAVNNDGLFSSLNPGISSTVNTIHIQATNMETTITLLSTMNSTVFQSSLINVSSVIGLLSGMFITGILSGIYFISKSKVDKLNGSRLNKEKKSILEKIKYHGSQRKRKNNDKKMSIEGPINIIEQILEESEK